LSELNFSSTPISRKPQYRLAVLRRLPTLDSLDGKEIPAEEKRRVEMQTGGSVNPLQQSVPNVHFAAYP
jgi:hypothetical protein